MVRILCVCIGRLECIVLCDCEIVAVVFRHAVQTRLCTGCARPEHHKINGTSNGKIGGHDFHEDADAVVAALACVQYTNEKAYVPSYVYPDNFGVDLANAFSWSSQKGSSNSSSASACAGDMVDLKPNILLGRYEARMDRHSCSHEQEAFLPVSCMQCCCILSYAGGAPCFVSILAFHLVKNVLRITVTSYVISFVCPKISVFLTYHVQASD